MKFHKSPRLRNLCLMVVASALILGCGSSGSTSKESVETTVASVSDSVADTVADSSSSTGVSSTVADDVARIRVTVGVDSGPQRVENVALNQQVELTIVNPKADDEFHLHGYDLGGGATKAGEEKTFAFTATEAGEFEVESHVTETVLVVLKVS